MSKNFAINTLVWAKMKGFAPWPGRIAVAPDSCKKPKGKGPQHCIFFFGTDNYAWIEESNIKNYQAYKSQFNKTNKPGLKEAIIAIEEYIEKKGGATTEESAVEEEFDRLKESSDDPKPTSPAPKPKKERKRKEKENDSSTPVKKRHIDYNSHSISETPDRSSITNHSFIKKSVASTLLERPAATTAQSADLDVALVSQTLREKNIQASNLKFGFLGLGVMGSGMVKNVINSGHSVVVWNRTPTKCDKFVEVGAQVAQTPSDVIDMCDITFSCVSDPTACKEMVFGNCGVMSTMLSGKGYVEMTTIDPKTSQAHADVITAGGGRYLEAQIQGSRCEAEEGSLIIVAAGNRSLFDDCQSCFEAMSKNSFFLGEVGNASKMSLILNMINGIALAGLAEGLALADRSEVQQNDVLEVLQLTNFASPLLVEKAKAIIDGGFPTNQALSLMQKDLRLGLELSDASELPLPLCATTNEIYKHAKRLGYSDHDVSAVYIRARF